jgi:hypothetical protein
MGDEHRLLSACGSVLSAERKACRVKMTKALLNPFVDTHRQGKCTQEEITPIRVDRIEAAARFETVKHVSVDAWTKQHVEGFVHKKLWDQRQGPMGKPSAVQHHPRHGFACRNLLLFMASQARVDHLNDPYIFDH